MDCAQSNWQRNPSQSPPLSINSVSHLMAEVYTVIALLRVQEECLRFEVLCDKNSKAKPGKVAQGR
jgi:hypothetical protein